MNLLTRLLRREPEIARYSWDQYQNDLSFAFNGQRYLLSGGSTGWSRTEDLETSFTSYISSLYKSNGIVFAIILARMLLFTEARFAWFEINENGEDGRPKGRDGLEVLETPWPNCGTGELLARMEQDVSLGGNFYAVREGSRLRRLRPDWVTIVLTAPPAESTYSDVAGYWYHPGRSYQSAGEPGPGDDVYLPGELAHFSPIPDPDAQYRGMSWLTPAIKEVQADKAAMEHKLNFFVNGASFGAIISAKESLTNQQYKEWKANFEGVHTGAGNAYKTLFLASPVDTAVTTANMQQLDFKVTVGAGETRLCALGGVPPIIVGLSEGLASATYSNYGMARRKFGDHWAHPQWKMASQALSSIVDAPSEDLRLGVNTKGIAFLREDAKDLAEIQQIKASTLSTLIMAGYTPESSAAAVDAEDLSLLEHTGLTSVQLVPPGTDPMAEEALGEEFEDEFAEEDEFDGEVLEEEVGRARYNVRVPEGFEGGGRFRKLSDAIVALLKDGADLDDFTQPQLRKAADQLGLVTPRARYSRDHLERLLRQHAGGGRGDSGSSRPRKRAPAKPGTDTDTGRRGKLSPARHAAVLGAHPAGARLDKISKRDRDELEKAGYIRFGVESYALTEKGRTYAGRFVDAPEGDDETDAPDSVDKARTRQADIDSARRYADVAAELDELIANEASNDTIWARLTGTTRRVSTPDSLDANDRKVLGDAERNGSVSTRPELTGAGRQHNQRLRDLTRKGLMAKERGQDRYKLTDAGRAALADTSGEEFHAEMEPVIEAFGRHEDPDLARRLMAEILAAQGISQDGNAGESGRYDPKIHQPVDGSLRQGQSVEVVRPGFTLERDGEKIRIRKAAVGAVDEPAGPTTPSDMLPGEGPVDYKRRKQVEALSSGVAGQTSQAEALEYLKGRKTSELRLLAREFGVDTRVPVDYGDSKARTSVSSQTRAATHDELAEFVLSAFVFEGYRNRWEQNATARVDAPDTGSPDVDESAPDLSDLSSLDTEDLRDTLDLKKLPELKDMLRQRGLKVSGRKRELVDRLVEDIRDARDLRPGDSPTAPTRRAGFDVSEVAGRVAGASSEAGVITLLASDPTLTAAKLRKVAEHLGIDVPESVKAKTALQLLIAEHEAEVRNLPGGFSRSETPDSDDIERADYDEPEDDDPGEPDDEMRSRAQARMDEIDDEDDEPEDEYDAYRAAGMDTNPGGEQLHHYWTRGAGLRRWAGSPHPWTALYRNLARHVGAARAKRMASAWFHEVFGIWSGERKGDNPVGPG